jgi:hypothetical protein
VSLVAILAALSPHPKIPFLADRPWRSKPATFATLEPDLGWAATERPRRSARNWGTSKLRSSCRRRSSTQHLPNDLKFLLSDSIELNDFRITGLWMRPLASADGLARRPGGAQPFPGPRHWRRTVAGGQSCTELEAITECCWTYWRRLPGRNYEDRGRMCQAGAAPLFIPVMAHPQSPPPRPDLAAVAGRLVDNKTRLARIDDLSTII